MDFERRIYLVQSRFFPSFNVTLNSNICSDGRYSCRLLDLMRRERVHRLSLGVVVVKVSAIDRSTKGP